MPSADIIVLMMGVWRTGNGRYVVARVSHMRRRWQIVDNALSHSCFRALKYLDIVIYL